MENQKMPEYETIRAAVAGEKWAVEKVVDCYKDEIDRLSDSSCRLSCHIRQLASQRQTAIHH